jgi:hypothetical protein
MLQAEATAQHHARVLDEIVGSRSWRITAPLRRANKLAQVARERLAERR